MLFLLKKRLKDFWKNFWTSKITIMWTVSASKHGVVQNSSCPGCHRQRWQTWELSGSYRHCRYRTALRRPGAWSGHQWSWYSKRVWSDRFPWCGEDNRYPPPLPMIAICYHKSNYLSLTTILTHRATWMGMRLRKSLRPSNGMPRQRKKPVMSTLC